MKNGSQLQKPIHRHGKWKCLRCANLGRTSWPNIYPGCVRCAVEGVTIKAPTARDARCKVT